ncbi:MAG TPA: (d)CMP kinase [Solirubrobacteraceae bacterium]|nr:(d)CMP kinase [Solirubrobacteraceae bacterium]
MIIAIDGPAGAGKSSVARALAERLTARYLDSGAMYRCVALASLEDLSRTPAELAEAIQIELGPYVLLDGGDVTAAIRAPEVSAQASLIATDPDVRAALVAHQRELLATGDWIAEGRDIGTVVAPHADLKIFLTASEAERAIRRGESVSERDTRDSTRIHSPLQPAADATLLDTTGLTLEEVVEQIIKLAETAIAGRA